MTTRSKVARRAIAKQRRDRWRWRLARWVMGDIWGGPGRRPEHGLTIYASPSGAVQLYRRANAVMLELSVYQAGTRAAAESTLTPQQAASLADALLYWVQRGELPERIADFGDLSNPNVCPHGYWICADCRHDGSGSALPVAG